MNNRRRVSLTQITSLLVASTLTLSSTGCIVSSTETIKTDRTYLLGPKTSSEPGPATRDITMRAVDTRGTLSFHLDRARECTITSTPRFQKVHIEGKKGKNIAAGIITGAILVGAGVGLVALVDTVSPEGWTTPKSDGTSGSDFTGGGLLGLTGIIVGVVGLFILPRGLYHAAVSGTTVTPNEVETGTPPAGGVRAPDGYDPKNPEVAALSPLMEQPRYKVLAFGSKPAGEIQGIPAWARKPAEESLRSASQLDRAMASPVESAATPALLAQSSGGGVSDEMKACVAKYTPSCQSKCGANKGCVLTCLREPCVDNLNKEGGAAGDSNDEYTTVTTKTEVCERAADSGIALTLVVRDLDGVPRTIDLGKTDKSGDAKKDILAGLEGVYPGWPDIKQVILQEANVVLVEDPAVLLGKVDLAKYPGLKYAEHVQLTRKAREAMVAAEAARKEKEAKERQAMLEAAAKAADDALHADERKAEAASKAAACASQYRNKCNADCQGNQACVKKCLQKAPSCK
jgi:hypothetical protein